MFPIKTWYRKVPVCKMFAIKFDLKGPILQNLWMLCAKFGWNWLSGSGEEDFLILSMYFHHFIIISPLKRPGPFIWTNLNPLHLRMLCAKFGWNWPSGSGEDDENVKSLQTDRQTYLSFQLRWAKKQNINSQKWMQNQTKELITEIKKDNIT